MLLILSKSLYPTFIINVSLYASLSITALSLTSIQSLSIYILYAVVFFHPLCIAGVSFLLIIILIASSEVGTTASPTVCCLIHILYNSLGYIQRYYVTCIITYIYIHTVNHANMANLNMQMDLFVYGALFITIIVDWIAAVFTYRFFRHLYQLKQSQQSGASNIYTYIYI